MSLVDIIIIAILAVLCLVGVISYKNKLKSGCCGAGGDGLMKKVKVSDKNKEHYHYSTTLIIDGMVCSNCSKRVENALNSMGKTWAKVDLGTSTCRVLSKAPIDEKTLRSAVSRAGYTVIKIKQEMNR